MHGGREMRKAMRGHRRRISRQACARRPSPQRGWPLLAPNRSHGSRTDRPSMHVIRASPSASKIGQSNVQVFIGRCTRVLARLPYGQKTEPVSRFDYEEYAGVFAHESYLWGSAAVVVSWLLAQAFESAGWSFRAAGAGEAPEIPVHAFEKDGEMRMQPCAEIWLTSSGAAKIAAAGVTPIASIQGRDVVRITGLQSVAGGELAGRWG